MGREQTVVHSEKEIRGIRVACAKAAEALDALCAFVRPGLTTLELDHLAEEAIRATGGSSAFLGYHGYPGQACISINEEVVHGIGRANRVILAGDLVSLDVGVGYDGYIGDNARTVCAGGSPDPLRAKLLAATKAALDAGIAEARGGRHVNDISRAVEAVVVSNGFGVVRDFVGHGCGCELHEPPQIPNFAQRSRGPRLVPGMVLAIEPMVNAGTHRVKQDKSDGWTVRSADGSLSAHFEHTVLVTRNKPEILTWPKTVSE
ncbi:MAG: type I methionyl aminopeptidase [Lentisphaeria bacterium]|nr:type I methionyl aminopeptidase [Lentisphaeria bacterium]